MQTDLLRLFYLVLILFHRVYNNNNNRNNDKKNVIRLYQTLKQYTVLEYKRNGLSKRQIYGDQNLIKKYQNLIIKHYFTDKIC